MNFSFILEGRGLRFSFLYFIHNRGALFMCCLDGCVLFAQICLRWKIENTWLVFEQWTLSHQTRWGGFLPTSAPTSKCLIQPITGYSSLLWVTLTIHSVITNVSIVTELFTVRAHWPRAGSIITPRPPTSLMRCSTQIKHEFQIFSQFNNVFKGISRFRPYVANSLLAFNVKSDSLRFSLLLAGIFLGDN